jgi:hypothetical protein
MKQILNKALEIVLLAILAIIPFSYKEVSNKWQVLLIFVTVSLICARIFQKKRSLSISNLGVVFAVLVMLLFDFTEKVNFVQQFNIPIEFGVRVPLSILLLAIGMLIFALKVLFVEKLQITNNHFARYFLYSSLLLIAIMLLFYPFLFYNYRMNLNSDVQLLNHISKYLMIFLLVTNYISDEKRIKRINVILIISLSITVVFCFLFEK